MNQAAAVEHRAVWPLWGAAALAVIGGLLPIAFGGTSSRIDSVIVPYLAGALAFSLCALLSNQGRTVTYTLYFVAGLAIVFGLLSMFSLPVRLAALGSCAAPPAPCLSGLPRVLTDGENTGMGAASAFGILAIFLGFYGLVAIVRRPQTASAPPVRKIPPVAPPKPVGAESGPAVAEPETEAPAADEKPELSAREAVEEEPELPPHEEEELPELPSHESGSTSS